MWKEYFIKSKLYTKQEQKSQETQESYSSLLLHQLKAERYSYILLAPRILVPSFYQIHQFITKASSLPSSLNPPLPWVPQYLDLPSSAQNGPNDSYTYLIKLLYYYLITLQTSGTLPHTHMLQHNDPPLPTHPHPHAHTNHSPDIQFYQYHSDHHNSDYETYNTDFQYIDNPFRHVKKFAKDIKKQYTHLKHLIKQYKSIKNGRNNRSAQQQAQSTAAQINELKLLIQSQKVEYSTAKCDMKYNIQDCRTEKQLLQKCMQEFDENQKMDFNNPENSIILNVQEQDKQKRIAEMKEEYINFNKWIKKEKLISTKCIKEIDRVLKLVEWELCKVEAEIEKDRKQKSVRFQNDRSRRHSQNNIENLSYNQRSILKNGQIVNIKKKQPIKRQQIQIKSITLQFQHQNPKATHKKETPFTNNPNNQFMPSNVRMFAKNPKMKQGRQLQESTCKSLQMGKGKMGRSLVESHVDKSSEKFGIFNQKYDYLQIQSSILLNKSLQIPKFVDSSPLVKEHKKVKKVYFK